VALEGFGTPEQYNDSALLRRSRIWASATPYLRPLYLKGRNPLEETGQMIQSECERRGWPAPVIKFDGDQITAGRNICVGGQPRNVLTFHRFRSRRGLPQPDRTGLAVRLEFSEDIVGPLALGFGCHYGLGLFRAE
jgi:CRISPR-associated protein Csb2